jgi:DNA polymerase-1
MTTYIGIEHLPVLQNAVSIVFDTETLGLQPRPGGLRLLQLGNPATRDIVVIDMFDCTVQDLAKLERFFTNGERFWTAFNTVFDLGWLQENGYHLRGRTRDLMLASRLLHNGIPLLKHSLAAVAKRELGVELDKTQQTSDWSGKLSEEQILYAAKDVEILMDLDLVFDKKLQAAGLAKAYVMECRAMPAMAQMWRTGLTFDTEELLMVQGDYEYDVKTLGEQFIRDLDRQLPKEHKLPRDEDGSFNLRPKDTGSIRAGTKQYAGFNLNSPKQLLEKFTALLGEAPFDEKNQRPSAGAGALKPYAADSYAVQTYLKWKRIEKRLQMVKKLLELADDKGVIRASYQQLGADTGRMTCRSPNLQQIPRDEEFRKCVVAPEGWKLIDADFSQMELRLAAAVSGDIEMATAFIDGEDLHQKTADAIGCTRQIAKSANFGLLYGSGAKGLRNYAGSQGIILPLPEAERVRAKWLQTYHGIAQWQREQARLADNTARERMPSCRVPVSEMRRLLPDKQNRLTVRANTPIQGAGAAVLKVALGNLWQFIRDHESEVRIAACVHDEILLVVKAEKAGIYSQILKDCMESALAKWLGQIPSIADVKIGDSWHETH